MASPERPTLSPAKKQEDGKAKEDGKGGWEKEILRSTSPKNPEQSKYYEKSLSIKNRSKNKIKDVICINHDHEHSLSHGYSQ